MARTPLAGSFWPNETQRLLLRAAILDGEAGAEAWLALRPSLNLDEVRSPSTAILPRLYKQLERLGIDDPRLPRLRGIYRRTWYVNQLVLDRLAPRVRAVQDAGADPLVVSSWELPLRWYGDLGARAVPVLHLLVRPEHFAAARGAAGVDDELVVHRRLFDEFREPADLWAASVELELGSVTACTLGSADELLNVCVAGARTNVPPGILWLADAATVVAAAGPELDWDRLVAQARRVRAALRVRDALAYLRDELDVPVPDTALAELAAEPASRRELLAHRVAGRGVGRLGAPSPALIRFLHVTADRPLPRALGSLPSFLRDEWGLERRSQIPLRAARKGAARLARTGRR